jgi:hypothetical protein
LRDPGSNCKNKSNGKTKATAGSFASLRNDKQKGKQQQGQEQLQGQQQRHRIITCWEKEV